MKDELLHFHCKMTRHFHILTWMHQEKIFVCWPFHELNFFLNIYSFLNISYSKLEFSDRLVFVICTTLDDFVTYTVSYYKLTSTRLIRVLMRAKNPFFVNGSLCGPITITHELCLCGRVKENPKG